MKQFPLITPSHGFFLQFKNLPDKVLEYWNEVLHENGFLCTQLLKELNFEKNMALISLHNKTKLK